MVEDTREEAVGKSPLHKGSQLNRYDIRGKHFKPFRRKSFTGALKLCRARTEVLSGDHRPWIMTGDVWNKENVQERNTSGQSGYIDSD